MSETNMHIQEAASHVATAAAQLESLVNELRVDYREGAFNREPVGSPAYVRRLRDQAALKELPGCMEGDVQRAVDQADALIRALGYQPLGEPGKEE